MMSTFHQVTHGQIIADALASIVAEIPTEFTVAMHDYLPFQGYK
jgi:hypothetical protein